MKKQVSFILLLVLCAISASATPVSKSKAQAIAASFFQKNSTMAKAKAKNNAVMLCKEYASRKDAPTAFYAFSRGENVVFVSAEEEMPAILGYSERANLDNLPPAMEYMLDYYAHLTDAVRNGEIQAPKLYASADAVEPLCKTIWGQEEPFCSLSPVMEGEKAPNGCLSTAFAQVMKYHEWPKKGEGTTETYKTCENPLKPSEKTPVMDIPAVDLSTHTYNWADMIDDYTGSYTEVQGQAVAQLCYDIAVASQMNFAPRSNGGSGTPLVYGANALRTYFGYNKDMYLDYAAFYTEEEWVEMLKNEINQTRPLLFSAHNINNQTQGHCFIIDGYNVEGFFHVNWGWDGDSNDYFLITSLTPPTLGTGGGNKGANFTHNQHTIFNCIPDRKGTSVASEHYKFEYSHCTEGNHASSIHIGHLENLSLDDFHGNILLQLIDKDGKVADQQIVMHDVTIKKCTNRSLEVSLEVFDFSHIVDGIYDIKIVAVSDATKNEFPTRNTARNSPIMVENGKLKEILNTALLEGEIIGCEFLEKDEFNIQLNVKARVKNIDDIPFSSEDTLGVYVGGDLCYVSGEIISGWTNKCCYVKEIKPGESVEYEGKLIRDYLFDDFDQQVIKLRLQYPNGLLDEKEFPLGDLMATAINDMKADKELNNAPAYNTMGQRVNPKTAKGIIIQNGKKFLGK